MQGYLVSAIVYQKGVQRVLLMGDCHISHVLDTMHAELVIMTAERHIPGFKLLIEGNAQLIKESYASLNDHLLLVKLWLWAHKIQALNCIYIDARHAIAQLYKIVLRGKDKVTPALWIAVRNELQKLLSEYENLRSQWHDQMNKHVLDLLALNVKEKMLGLDEYIKQNEVEQLATQLFLHAADLNFCMELSKQLTIDKAILVIVGQDHIWRIDQMLRSREFTQITAYEAQYDQSWPALTQQALSECLNLLLG